MKIIRISAHGFKSFADKINIEVKDGITGIVGPNGSGKSNIVDAIKWVLGEQSLKDIRAGQNSTDIIFNGSKSRKPLTRAWVAITFDNSDHYLNSDLKELEIKREIYSSGENAYYINNESVRLKDITDLFIDSGSSVNSLSIISQGKISEIINGKPEEKRSIIEEAAGVLKYKKRKEESLRKLEKTNDNLEKINLIINELIVNVEPLKIQAESASKYLKYKQELESIEIGLLAYDINNINDDYLKHKKEKEELNQRIISYDNASVVDSSKIDSIKIQIMKFDDDISKKSDELFKLTNEEALIASEKQIMLERQKLNVSSSLIESNLLSLKEKELKFKSNIKTLKEEIKVKEEELKSKETIGSNLVNELKVINLKRNNLFNDLTKLNKEEASLKNSIDILKENIDNDNRLPYQVKNVINNHRLMGIHNVFSKLIETEEKYACAIDIALGYTSNVVVVDNENNARDAIMHLKQNGLGRVTFYPLNAIRPKGIDDNTLNKLNNEPSFIGVASSLVRFDSLYKNIVLNTLGNIIIVDNLVNANKIAKLINYSYRIVTLDGDLINAGGSITGGTTNNKNSVINQKFELENQIKLLDIKANDIRLKEEEINNLDSDLKILENKVFNHNNEVNVLKELLVRRNADLSNLNIELEKTNNEINGNKGMLSGKVNDEVDKILNKYYECNSKKEALEVKINSLKSEKNDLQTELNELEINNRKQNSEYNKLVVELSDLNLTITKEEMKLDSFLLRLNEEYGITFERAKNEYVLHEDINEARAKVNSLKRDIKSLGDVNTGSISEYERVNSRYEFLDKQRNDLQTSINDILEIINELDSTMKDKLTKTFNNLNYEFKVAFAKLFRGGEAQLILTNPDDILTTGVEIKAVPPGKDIKNTKLLSGGEATLTAIALVFAMLNIRTVPFCVLDEVEAALDEANVDMFGNYLKNVKSYTQFIIITHKKRTMEYTDNLYGITMQESGVSKLVSVKLN